MTASYHVYFSPKPHVSEQVLLRQVRLFMDSQVAGNLAMGYRIVRFDDKGNFEGLPDFHLTVDYPSYPVRQKALGNMKTKYKEEPHAPLMDMVSEFRVAFSEDDVRGGVQ